jgi:hypothetical protein
LRGGAKGSPAALFVAGIGPKGRTMSAMSASTSLKVG